MTPTPIASINQIAEDTYRISIALPALMPGGFSFNQYLVVDEMPLLFHTGPKRLFALIREQIETVLPVSKLRYIAFSHVEADESGSLPEFLAAAPQSRPVCSEVAAMISIGDLAADHGRRPEAKPGPASTGVAIDPASAAWMGLRLLFR
jgi:flavorubredoxin